MIPNIECLNYHIEFFVISIVLFFIIWYFYNKNKKIGMYFTFLSMLIACLSPFLTNYGPAVLMKIILVTVFSLLLFVSIQYKCIDITSILTNLFRLNIACMIITVHELWIILLLIIAVITTPIVTVKNGKVILKSFFLSLDIWILLSSIALLFAYLYNTFFCANIYMIIAAILIPVIIHFTSNQFLESRLIFLCLVIWLNLFQNNDKTVNQLFKNFKF